MPNPDDFSQVVSGGLWSDAANWSEGVPSDGGNVVATGTGNDDLSSLSLTSLLLSPDSTVNVTDGTLTVGTVSGDSTSDFIADGGFDTVTVTVGTISGTGGTYGAAGANSVFIDNSASDSGNFYYAIAGGEFVLAAAPVASSYLAYDDTGAPSTIALKDPGAVTSAPIENLSNGDVLELPGTSVSSVSIGASSVSVTTSAGTFVFSDVNYLGLQVNGYSASFDSSTGLEAITFTAPDTFDDTQSGGLWSDAALWSEGITPADGTGAAAATSGYDDLSSLSLSSLSIAGSANVEVTDGTLSVGTVSGTINSFLIASGGGNPATTVPVTVTVGSISGTGAFYGASGAKSVFIDNSTTDSGNYYYATAGGKIVLAAAPAASSSLDYDNTGTSSTIALKDPGAITSTPIENLEQDDVLELPGTSVSSVTYGPGSLNITTNAGSFTFSDVNYLTNYQQFSGYSASFDASTGLEAITFEPDVFSPVSGQLWSTAANWSGGVPGNGANVELTGDSEDDLSSLSLTNLIQTGSADTQVTQGTLSIGTLSSSGEAQLEAYGGTNPRPRRR